MSRVYRRLALAVAPVACAATVAACSGSAHVTHTVSKESVAKTGAAQFSKQFGVKFTMSCPHDLDAKKGTKMRCVTTNPAGTRIGTTVTVTSVKGKKVYFDFKNDDHPLK